MASKIPKQQFHKDLQNIAPFVYQMNFFLSNKWTFRNILYPIFRLSKGKNVKELHNEEIFIKSNNGGPDIRLKIYKPKDSREKLPVMLYLHGGGFATGCPEQFGNVYKDFITKRPCIIVSPDFRNSIKAPYPAGFNDCYDTLLWIKDNADQLNAREDKIIVAGHSGGGGLTAAVTLKARDTQDVNIAFQMPIYPMLDDRQTSASSQLIVPGWDKNANANGWDFYLEDLRSKNLETPVYAAPGRNQDYSNFPPTITFVSEYEPFRDETLEYVENLKKYNIPVLFKHYEKCFHGFEQIAPKTEIGKDALNFTYDSYAQYYDKYL